jgi:5-methylcytosine-specific restriction endonuclease McrA
MRELPLVLQLDVSGNPQQWITYEDSAYHYAKDNVAWSMGEVDFDIHGGTCAKTGERSTLTINTIIAIKGMPSHKAMKHYNRVPLTNRTLFRRDQNVCAYCGEQFSTGHLTRDHIHPTSKGGKNIWTNVVTACSSCNKHKDDYMLDQINMKLLYVPYVPNRAEWLILENRKILGDQMDFLIKKVPKESRLLVA